MMVYDFSDEADWFICCVTTRLHLLMQATY